MFSQCGSQPFGARNAESVRTMISYPWRTGAHRSSSSAYCGRLIGRFGVALPVIPLGLHKGAVCKTVAFVCLGSSPPLA